MRLRPAYALLPFLRSRCADAVPEKAKAAIKKIWTKTVTLGKEDGTGEDAVDVNNDSLVLREVLKQIGELREIQEAKNEGGPLPRDAKSAV